MRTLFRNTLFVLACLLALAGPVHAQSPVRTLVTGGAAQSDAPTSGPAWRAVVRSRQVTLNAGVLADVQSDAARFPGVMQEIGIEFFPDASFVILVRSVEDLGGGSTAFHGMVSGIASSTATLVRNAGAVAVNVSARGRQWQIRSRGPGAFDAREVDTSLFIDHGQPPIEINAAPKSRTKVEVAADDGSLVDVMVLYTQGARAAAGGTAAMNALVDLGITETNQAYASGGAIQRLRLVLKREIAYAETNMSPDLSRLAGNGDGFLDEAHALRNAYGADLVSLWGDFPPGDGCGLGYLMSTESSGFDVNGFNVADYTCATGNYSFGHELGHNMGLRHDPYVDSGTNTINGVPGIAYAKGYVDTAIRKRTIMAYNDSLPRHAPGRPTAPASAFSPRRSRTSRRRRRSPATRGTAMPYSPSTTRATRWPTSARRWSFPPAASSSFSSRPRR